MANKLDKEYIRAWFTFIGTPEELEEAMCYIKGFAEEAVISHTKICVEIHTEYRPLNLQQPCSNIPFQAGMTS